MAENNITKAARDKWPPVGCYGNILISLVECHAETKIVFQGVRDGIENFCKKLEEKSDEIEIMQTGSSYDGLSISMYHKDEATGRTVFLPETDFDFMMIFSKYIVNDRSKQSVASSDSVTETSSESTNIVKQDKTDALKADVTSVESSIADLNIRTGVASEERKLHGDSVSHDASVRPKSIKQQYEIPQIKMLFDRNTSDYFAEMIPSERVGYMYIVLTTKGKQQLESQGAKFPQAYKIIDQVTHNWLIPNSIFKGEQVLKEYSTSGPALSKFDELDTSNYSYDFVFAFPCNSWPLAADEWLKRKRKWPPSDVIDKLQNGGCHVVPCGYYDDPMSQYQWRLSLNKAERVLSRLLTTVQRRCYILVKLLLKQTLPSGSALSSYHVKNLLFWLCEDHPPEEWKEEQLGRWIHHLLHYVAVSLANHNIANYFIVDNNMIRHKSPDVVKETLKHVQNLMDTPMSHLSKTLQYIGLYDKTKVAIKTKFSGESHSALVVYVVLIEYLKGRAMSALCTKQGIEALRMITILNRSAPEGSQRIGAFHTAEDLVDLLWPLATAFTSDGDLTKAVWLYEAILEENKEDSLKRYPQILTNLACGYNALSQQIEDSNRKIMCVTKAKGYFNEALTTTQPSTGLYFTYGSFLLTNDLLGDAELMLRLAIATSPGEDDNTAFVQIEIPGMAEKTNQSSNVPISIASRYFLVDCLIQKGLPEDCDALVKDMECVSAGVEINDQPLCFYMTGVCYNKLGLKQKGSELIERAKDLENVLK